MTGYQEMIQQIVDTYTKGEQIQVCIEEMAELTQALCKDLRGKGNWNHILEELCDAEIMLEQIKQYYFFSERLIEKVKTDKLQRTIDRIGE